MIKIFFFFILMIICPILVEADSLNDLVTFTIENKNYFDVEKKYNDSFSFRISYNEIIQENLNEILSLSIKEDNDILYVYDKLYIDTSTHYSFMDEKQYYLGENNSFLLKQAILPASEKIIKYKNEIEVPVFKLKYRFDEEDEWIIMDNQTNMLTVREFLVQKLNISDLHSIYDKLYKIEEIPSSHIYNIRLDFYKSLSNINAILDENSIYYNASSLEMITTSNIFIYYESIKSSSISIDTIFVPTKKEDKTLISIITLITLIIGGTFIFSLKK